MNPKSTTFVERMGFKDVELTTPKHDEIVIWLMNPNNLAKVLFKINERTTIIEEKPFWCRINDYNECKHAQKHESGHCVPFYFSDGMKHIDLCPLHDEFNENTQKINMNDEIFVSLISKIEAEHPINNSYNKFLIGFVDLKIELINYIQTANFRRHLTGIGKPSKDNDSLIEYFVEVKTNITSFGETLRQINTYRQFREGNYVLVTPKTPFKEPFEANGIHVYEID